MSVSSKFICKCGEMENWIEENKTTEPCPNCGTKYIGYYNRNKFTLEAKEVRIGMNFYQMLSSTIKKLMTDKK